MGQGGVDPARRLGDGTFGPKQTYRAGKDPDGVALADVNHDGMLDLAVTNHLDDSVSVLLGTGNGTFGAEARYPVPWGPEAVVVADFDGDGHPDIATSAVVESPGVATGRGDGTFVPAGSLAWWPGQGGAVADFNRDGRPDLAFAHTEVPEATVYLNWTGLPAPPCVVLGERNDPLRFTKDHLRLGGCQLGRVRPPLLTQRPQEPRNLREPANRLSATKPKPRRARRQPRPTTLAAHCRFDADAAALATRRDACLGRTSTSGSSSRAYTPASARGKRASARAPGCSQPLRPERA